MRHLFAIAVLMMACDEPTQTLRVEVCGDLVVPSEVQALRVVVRGDDRVERWSGVTPLADAPPDAGTPDAGTPDAGPAQGACPGGVALHAVLEMEAAGGQPWVEVQALNAGVTVATGEARAVQDAVTVIVAAACLGVRCAEGQTCVDGPCEAVPLGGDLNRCPAACGP
jgi:hypothetical protein